MARDSLDVSTRPQGTTDHDIAATRVARSVLFFVVLLAYGGCLAYAPLLNPQPGSFFYGWSVMILTGLILALSVRQVHITNVIRTCLFTLLCSQLIAMLIWNILNSKFQPAALLLYPAGICVIEVCLAYRVARSDAKRA